MLAPAIFRSCHVANARRFVAPPRSLRSVLDVHPGTRQYLPTLQDQVPRVDLHHGGFDSIDGGFDHSIHKTLEHQIANFGRWNMPLSRWNITHTAGCGFSPRRQVLHMKFGPSGSNRRCTLGILFFTASASFLPLVRRLRQTQHSGGILDACTAPWHSI